MDFPPGFEGNRVNQVCKLKKTLYDLKQSASAWFVRFTNLSKAKDTYTYGLLHIHIQLKAKPDQDFTLGELN